MLPVIIFIVEYIHKVLYLNHIYVECFKYCDGVINLSLCDSYSSSILSSF